MGTTVQSAGQLPVRVHHRRHAAAIAGWRPGASGEPGGQGGWACAAGGWLRGPSASSGCSLPASYSIEYKTLRSFTAWGDQGPFEHPTRSPARPGTIPPCLIFPGVVQFSVSVFSASTFPAFPGKVENCHFGELPEVPTDTADLTNGIPGWSWTRTMTVRKLARSARRLRPP